MFLCLVIACWGVSAPYARTISQEVDARHQRELEARNQELAEKVASATLEQLRAKILADFDVLKAVAPSPARDAHEAAWDLKYLKERQMILGICLVQAFNFFNGLRSRFCLVAMIAVIGFCCWLPKLLCEEGADLCQDLDAKELQHRVAHQLSVVQHSWSLCKVHFGAGCRRWYRAACFL